MAKLKGSTAVKEIKKEYLVRHLDDMEHRAQSWLESHWSREYFHPDGTYIANSLAGKGVPSKSVLGADPELNHILRRHLRSRALWTHHGVWERAVGRLSQVEEGIAILAAPIAQTHQLQGPFTYTSAFLGSALAEAFKCVRGTGSPSVYTPYTPSGVLLGRYMIEQSAEGGDVPRVGRQHQLLVSELLDHNRHPALDTAFHEAGRLQGDLEREEKAVRKLAADALKAKDFLYPCRYCKRLWQD